MLPCFENCLQIDEPPITFDKVVIDLRRNLAGIQQSRPIHRALFTVTGNPSERIWIDLVARHIATADLLDDAIAFQGEKQKPNRDVHFSSSERVAGTDKLFERAAEISSVTAVRGNEKSR